MGFGVVGGGQRELGSDDRRGIRKNRVRIEVARLQGGFEKGEGTMRICREVPMYRKRETQTDEGKELPVERLRMRLRMHRIRRERIESVR